MKLKTFILLIMLLAVFGCAKTQINDSFTNIQDENPAARIAILANEKEHLEFSNCLQNELREMFPDLEIMPEEIFRASLFPWLEYVTAPKDIDEITRLFKRKSVIKRVKSSGVEIVVFVHGSSKIEDAKGFIGYGAGYGAVGFFGYLSWDEESYLGTSVYSFRDEAWLGVSNVSSKGNSKMPAFIIPIPIPASTKNYVCINTAELLAECLGRELPSLDDSAYR